jgi:hypothetical protein
MFTQQTQTLNLLKLDYRWRKPAKTGLCAQTHIPKPSPPPVNTLSILNVLKNTTKHKSLICSQLSCIPL